MSDPGISAGFPQPSAPFVDSNGRINQTWLQLLIALWNRTGAGLGIDLEAEEELIGQIITGQGALSGSLQAERAATLAQIGVLATRITTRPTAPVLQQLGMSLLALAAALKQERPLALPQTTVPTTPTPQLPAILAVQAQQAPSLPTAPVPTAPLPIFAPRPIVAPRSGPVPPTDITPGLSPYVYQSSFTGMLSIVAGTVSMVEFSRDGGTTFIDLGVTGGIVPMLAGDQARITYIVAPTLTFIGL